MIHETSQPHRPRVFTTPRHCPQQVAVDPVTPQVNGLAPARSNETGQCPPSRTAPPLLSDLNAELGTQLLEAQCSRNTPGGGRARAPLRQQPDSEGMSDRR
jgi:hypothetical protein